MTRKQWIGTLERPQELLVFPVLAAGCANLERKGGSILLPSAPVIVGVLFWSLTKTMDKGWKGIEHDYIITDYYVITMNLNAHDRIHESPWCAKVAWLFELQSEDTNGVAALPGHILFFQADGAVAICCMFSGSKLYPSGEASFKIWKMLKASADATSPSECLQNNLCPL